MSRSTVTLPTPSESRNPRRVLERLAFWTAVVVPFSYLPLLYGGLGGGEFALLVGLLALNAASLVLGQGYRRG